MGDLAAFVAVGLEAGAKATGEKTEYTTSDAGYLFDLGDLPEIMRGFAAFMPKGAGEAAASLTAEATPSVSPN